MMNTTSLRAQDYYTIPTTCSCTTTTNLNHSWTRTTPTTKDPRCESCVIISFVVFELIFWLPSEAPWLFFFFFPSFSLSMCRSQFGSKLLQKCISQRFRSPISLNLNGFCHTVTHSLQAPEKESWLTLAAHSQTQHVTTGSYKQTICYTHADNSRGKKLN